LIQIRHDSKAVYSLYLGVMSQITNEEVLKLARLARLRLSKEEIEKYTVELDRIMNYVEMLSDVDTDDLAPTNQVTGLVNVSRPDIVKDYVAKPESLLALTPSNSDGFIKVKRMI
jgi:aspartyl-tRNA(Asn)/glutamyl-tRNA(Gln) amidotransferase subunit C